MVFSSVLFMFEYLPVVLAIYYLSPVRWRNPVLFAANLIFYGWGEPVYVFLMLFSITVNYINGILIDRYRQNRRRAKTVLIINIVINLAMLGFFKYYDLLAGTLSKIPFIDIKPLGLTLPIGISFYTFQTMSYPIDVYRGSADVQKNFISFGTFVALFPQLIAGPIIRYKDVASQLNYRPKNADQFASGVQRFMIGLCKKVLIANNIGSLWDIYSAMDFSHLTVVGGWMGVAAFSVQIYFDFSGYSDMAVGLGRMLGFEFRENFDYPYVSRSITEFWRRWHISLGTWFRDYVYIPLGGNRRGLKRQLLNIFIVWALTGFWHGANWTYLLWGLYYGAFLIIEKTFLLDLMEKWPAVFRRIYTLAVVMAAWPLFELNSVAAAGTYAGIMFGFGSAGFISPEDMYYIGTYGITFLIGAAAATPFGKNLFARIPEKVRSVLTPALIVIALVVTTAYMVDATYNPFLYFRF